MSKSAWFRIAAIVLCLLLSFWETDFSFAILWERGGRIFSMLGEMVPPDTDFLNIILGPLRDTVIISFLGTGIGAIAGAAGTFVCNSYVNRWKFVRIVLKTVVHLFRCIPVLILALLCTFLFGLGVWAGVVAIGISTCAIMTRLGYEDSENADMTAAAALEFTGAGRMKAYLSSIWQQIVPGFFSNLLYILESNVRNAALLGFVGAGGIGLLLNEKMAWREYSRVGMILCVLFAVVAAAEYLSEWLRAQLCAETKGRKVKYLPECFFLLLCVAAGIFLVWHPLPGGMNANAFASVLEGVVYPDITMLVSLQEDGVPRLLFETFCIAFLGTVGGTLVALLFSLLACFRFFGSAALPMRIVLLAVRSVPVLIVGLLWIRVTGPGAFAGVLTLALCSVGFLAKRFLIAIDSIDLRPYHALRATGICVLSAVRWGIVPQILPHYVSAVLYRLDINLRETAALGLVGAGGIGTTLFLAMNHYEWNQAGALLWGTILLVGVAGIISETYRKNYRMRDASQKSKK